MRFRQTVRTVAGGSGQVALGQQAGASQVPMPQGNNQWTADDPRPQEYVGHQGGLEQDLAGGLDASRR